MKEISIERFYKKLEKHDWFYLFSDDPYVHDIGSEMEKNLKLIAIENHWLDLFYDFRNYVFSNSVRNGKKSEKPALEDYK